MPRFIGILFTFLFTLSAFAEPTLKVGDKAPELKMEKWFNGNGFTGFKPGKVYVVEFWGTWCGPCVEQIPHLNRIAKEYAADIEVIGITVAARDQSKEDFFADLEKFFAGEQPKQEYLVGLDTEKEMSQAWQIASGSMGIPNLFVIDRDGTIALIEYPMIFTHEKFGNPLKQIIEGTWKTSKVRETYNAYVLKRQIQMSFHRAVNRNELNKALEIAREAGVKDPFFKRLEADLLIDNLARPEDGMKILRGLAKEHWDNTEELSTLIYLLVHEKLRPTSHFDPLLADQVQRRVIELIYNPKTEEQVNFSKSSWQYLSQVAIYYFATGMLDYAVHFQKQAVEGMPESHKETSLEYYTETLKKYEAAVAKRNRDQKEIDLNKEIQAAVNSEKWQKVLSLNREAQEVVLPENVFSYQKGELDMLINKLSRLEDAVDKLREFAMQHWNREDELAMLIEWLVHPKLVESPHFNKSLAGTVSHRVLDLLKNNPEGVKDLASFYYPPVASYFAAIGDFDNAIKFLEMGIGGLNTKDSLGFWGPIMNETLAQYKKAKDTKGYTDFIDNMIAGTDCTSKLTN